MGRCVTLVPPFPNELVAGFQLCSIVSSCQGIGARVEELVLGRTSRTTGREAMVEPSD